MLLHTAEYWMDSLKLEPHPEGGFFREVYRSGDSTSIYFLLAGDEFSAFHRLRKDEIWHFYDGSPLLVHTLTADGKHKMRRLHNNMEKNTSPQITIPRKTWLAGEVEKAAGYSLIGCTMAPAFNYDDFELGDESSLVKLYPRHKKLIQRLTRQIHVVLQD